MDATELSRWSRFAAKGGIGKCTALQDYVAEEPEDLMFMKDDEITVLMQLGDQEDVFLGYCEGVIGRFRSSYVRIHGRLKKPIMTKRSSSAQSTSPSLRSRSRSQSRPSSSQSAMTLATREAASPPVPFQGSPTASPAGSPRMSLSISASSSITTELNSSGSIGTSKLAHSSSMGMPRSPSPLRITHLKHEIPERSGSYSSSRSATLETAPPETPSTASPDNEEFAVRIAVHSRDHPEQLSPVVRESVLFGEDEQALAPIQGTSPLNIRKSPSVMETRLGEHASTSPARSVQSLAISPKSLSFGVDDADESSRLSLDMSAGVEGIGLSLLQGFIMGGNDDGASIFSGRSGANSPDQSVASTVNPDPGGAPTESPKSATQSMSHYSRTPSPEPYTDEFEPPKPPYARESQRSSMHSLKSTRSLQSLRPSLAGSENSGGSGSGWEGDIYDDYRYSRFSMASKMSGARLSQGSIRPAGDVPPIPNDHALSKLSRQGSLDDMRPPAAVVVSSESGTVMSQLQTVAEGPGSEKDLTLKDKDRPSPLSFADKDGGHAHSHAPTRYSNASTSHVASPLLHGSFGSPTQSTTPKTPASPDTPASIDSFVSPPPGSPERQRFDGLAPPREKDVDVRRASGQAIVIEDDEDMDLPNPSSPPMPPREDPAQFASAKAKAKEAAEDALLLSNEPAPPPYAMPGPSMSMHPIQAAVSPPPIQHAMSPPPIQHAMSPPPIQHAMSPPPQQSHPQLRMRSPNQPPADPAARTSLFMPHPHAPRPAQVPAGPMYGRQPTHLPPPQQYNGPLPGSAIHIMHMLLAAQQQGRRPGGASTIYARFERDLGTSMGPVLISFTLEPQMNIPANRPVGFDMQNHSGSRAGSPSAPQRIGTPIDASPYDVAASMAQGSGSGLSRSATASPNIGAGGMMRTGSPAMGPGAGLARAATTSPAMGMGPGPAAGPGRTATASPRPANGQMQPPGPPGEFGRPDSVGSGKAIPRPNFFPKAGTARPRSRSFSGFDSPVAEVILPRGEGSADGVSSAQLSSVALITKRSKSATATPVAAMSPVSVPTPQRATLSHTSSVVRGVQRPSPLSFSQNNVVAARASPAPFAGRPMLIPAASSAPGSPVSRAVFDRNGTMSPPQQRDVPTGGSSVRHQSTATIKSEHSASPSSPPSSPRSPASPRSAHPVVRRSRSSILLGTKTAQGDPALPPSPRALAVPGRPSIESSNTPPRPSVESIMSRQSADGSSATSLPMRRPSQLPMAMKVSSPSPDLSDSASGLSANRPSLRSRASSAGLRVQTPSERPLLQPSERSPASSVFSFDQLGEPKMHVSVKDMDFELVAPTVPRSPLATSSADSLLVPGASADVRSSIDVRASSLSLRRLQSEKPIGGERVAKVTDAAAAEAHRQRESRWISVLSSTSPSQARKTKRIRKLVLEGVPASVRYRVWAHLTDSKAKRMDGLYATLGRRGEVAQSPDIQQDAHAIFQDEPLLDRSLVDVLQAYLNMVPDVQYSKGLAMIAGQLLRQSPEEDAFWTFVTMMDSHIRPYFSLQPVLLEIDSSLFSKALESNDAALAQRILVEMAIPPICICRPWFTSLYADAFPTDFVLRVWDVFLFEGVAFLIRVGLAVISCCRESLLQCRGQEQLLATLAHPPLRSLPSTPDALIELALSVKLRDDDIYKQRYKLETQLKRQMQTRPHLSSARVSTPTISLPRS